MTLGISVFNGGAGIEGFTGVTLLGVVGTTGLTIWGLGFSSSESNKSMTAPWLPCGIYNTGGGNL